MWGLYWVIFSQVEALIYPKEELGDELMNEGALPPLLLIKEQNAFDEGGGLAERIQLPFVPAPCADKMDGAEGCFCF